MTDDQFANLVFVILDDDTIIITTDPTPEEAPDAQ